MGVGVKLCKICSVSGNNSALWMGLESSHRVVRQQSKVNMFRALQQLLISKTQRLLKNRFKGFELIRMEIGEMHVPAILI